MNHLKDRAKTISHDKILDELKNLGTAQNRKIYRRHGVGEKQYGVSFANLKNLAKKIKTDNQLAPQLWQSGIHDARILATMIVDPNEMEEDLLELWVNDLDNYVVTDSFSSMVSNTPYAQSKMEAWTLSNNEWIGSAGWNILLISEATQLRTRHGLG